jgi:hypothetical protein
MSAMMYSFLADLVLMVHLAFVVFVLCGGLIVLRWRWIAWLHLPAAAWGAVVEFSGWICPLTPLENWLRARAGEVGDEQDFMARYFLPILYPGDLTRDLQFLLGTAVVVLNTAIYCWLWHMRARGASGNR